MGAFLGSTTIRPGRVNVWGTLVGVAVLAIGIAGIQQFGGSFWVEPLFNGVTLLIDPMSYQYLVGAEIDYQEGLEGAQFVIKNPNATTTCGCGSSFSV